MIKFYSEEATIIEGRFAPFARVNGSQLVSVKSYPIETNVCHVIVNHTGSIPRLPDIVYR